MEDLGFINKNNFDYCINFLKRLKPFYCGLTWNCKNGLGGGAYSKGSLTKLGKNVVLELEKNNILIDTAHMNKKTFYKFVKITTKPIFNSHTNMFNLFSHVRNLNNNQIKLLCQSKGMFCVSFVSKFIAKDKITSNDVVKQILYFTSKFGFDNLALGTDFNGTNNLPNDVQNYSEITKIKNQLIDHNISIKNVNKILYKNLLKFYKTRCT